MKNGDQSAFPNQRNRGDLYGGLTKREYLAAMAMQGIEAANFASENQGVQSIEWVVHRAVRLADTLLVELAKEKRE